MMSSLDGFSLNTSRSLSWTSEGNRREYKKNLCFLNAVQNMVGSLSVACKAGFSDASCSSVMPAFVLFVLPWYNAIWTGRILSLLPIIFKHLFVSMLTNFMPIIVGYNIKWPESSNSMLPYKNVSDFSNSFSVAIRRLNSIAGIVWVFCCASVNRASVSSRTLISFPVKNLNIRTCK